MTTSQHSIRTTHHGKADSIYDSVDKLNEEEKSDQACSINKKTEKESKKKKRTLKGGNRTEDDSHLPIKTRKQNIKKKSKK